MFNTNENDCFIFLNGAFSDDIEYYRNLISNNKNIYCADGGANYCYKLGYTPLEIWGDLDSIDSKVLNYYTEKQILIKTFEREKDYTDMELLLRYLHNKYRYIYCLFGISSDMEHTLTNINLMKIYNNLIFINKNEIIFYIKKCNNFLIEDKENKKISFIPISNIKSLTLKGFKYEVNNININQGETLCSRNIIINKKAWINYEQGDIIAVLKIN